MILAPISKRRLGQSGVAVTPVGLGTARFAAGRGPRGRHYAQLSDESIQEVVYAALRNGVNWFETGGYSGRLAIEHALADALYRSGKGPGEVVIAARWRSAWRSAANIKAALAGMLERLDGFRVDLLQIHTPYSRSTMRGQLKVMADLCDAGHIRGVGVSDFSAREMRAAHRLLAGHGIPLACNQVHYSLCHRRIERNGILAAARELGISIVARSPLERGLLTGRFHRAGDLAAGRHGRGQLDRSRALVEALAQIGARHGATPAQVALNWVVNFHGDTVVAMPGASRPEQARENALAAALQLKPAETAILDELTRRFA